LHFGVFGSSQPSGSDINISSLHSFIVRTSQEIVTPMFCLRFTQVAKILELPAHATVVRIGSFDTVCTGALISSQLYGSVDSVNKSMTWSLTTGFFRPAYLKKKNSSFR